MICKKAVKESTVNTGLKLITSYVTLIILQYFNIMTISDNLNTNALYLTAIFTFISWVQNIFIRQVFGVQDKKEIARLNEQIAMLETELAKRIKC